MAEQPDFTDRFETALTTGRAHGNLDRIETRPCGSDSYDGTEYRFYGWYIPVRPIIDEVAQMDNFAIQTMGFNNELDEPFFQIFLADLRKEQEHPAFTETRH